MLVYDLDGLPHEKQPIDAKECVEKLGWTYQPPAIEAEKPKTAVKKAVKDDSNSITG